MSSSGGSDPNIDRLTGPSIAAITPGLYELEMRDGTRLKVAVGRCRGEPWYAPLEVLDGCSSMYDLITYNWCDVVAALGQKGDHDPRDEE